MHGSLTHHTNERISLFRIILSEGPVVAIQVCLFIYKRAKGVSFVHPSQTGWLCTRAFSISSVMH